ncbi:MAG: F0F1 ATP synthase subunit B [Fibrobacteres bacterium]|nr:F0F1 ATP synthase subunit B [Fibrobacterota bacterium]
MKDTITTHAEVQVHPKADGGGTNPLLRLDPGMVIWTWVVFGLLLVILGRFAWRPLLKMLEEREQKIKNAMDEVEKAKIVLSEAQEKAEKIIAEADEKSIDIINRSRESAQTVAMDVNKRALEESEKIIETGRRMIETETEKASNHLRRQTASIAVAVAEKLIREKLDDKKNYELTEKYIEEIIGNK